MISGHVLTQSAKVCFKLLFPEAMEKGLYKNLFRIEVGWGRGQEVLSLEIKAMWHEVICNMSSF